MKIALSYLFAASLLLSVSINGQKIQEQHQSIENVNTANGHVSIDTTIERNRLFRRRLHRLNRRVDLVEGVLPSVPVSGKEDPSSSSSSPSISAQLDTRSPSFSPPPESEKPVDTTTTTDPTTMTTIKTTTTTVAPDPTSQSVVPPVTTPEATTATTTEPPVTTTTTTEPPITTTTTTPEPPVTTTTTDPPVTTTTIDPPVTTTTTTIITTTTTQDVTTQPPTSTSDPTTTKSKATTSSDHQSTGSAIPPTVTSDGADKPSNIPSTSGSSSNKTGITIGVVVGAIVIAGAIGVWVFRKWKLSPSRQFKSKIRNSSGGFTRGVVGAGSVDHDEYDSYHDIFRPSAHDSAIPTSMPLVGSSVGSSPRQDHQQVSPQAQHMTQVQHMSMSSAAGTVPDYSQYRYTSSAQGYDSGISQTALGGNTVSGGVDYYHPQSDAYISQDYSMTGHANDQFLRELRE